MEKEQKFVSSSIYFDACLLEVGFDELQKVFNVKEEKDRRVVTEFTRSYLDRGTAAVDDLSTDTAWTVVQNLRVPLFPSVNDIDIIFDVSLPKNILRRALVGHLTDTHDGVGYATDAKTVKPSDTDQVIRSRSDGL